MTDPFFSIVITAFNAAQYIAETLESLQSQTFQNFEVLVVDDGSTDRTAELVSRYNRVTLIQQPNRGQPVARNNGIRHARADYIAFLDADDLWDPRKLEVQAEYLKSHPETVWVYCDALVFESDTKRVLHRVGHVMTLREGDILRPLLKGCFIASPTPVVKCSVFEEIGYFDESPELRIGEDWNMWLRIAERFPAGLINEPLAMVRKHEGNMTATTDPERGYQSRKRIAEAAIARNPEKLCDLRALVLADICVVTGNTYLRMGRPAAGRQKFAEALKHDSLRTDAYLSWLASWLSPVAQKQLRELRRRPWRSLQMNQSETAQT